MTWSGLATTERAFADTMVLQGVLGIQRNESMNGSAR